MNRNKTDIKLITENVRKQFLSKISDELELYYKSDVEMVETNIWWTERFVKFNHGNETKALKQMLNAFRWRKSFGINDRTAKDIPREFGDGGGIFPYGYDHKDRPILYCRVKVYQKIEELKLFFQQFVAGIVNHVDQLGGRKGFIIVFDISNIAIRNFDLDFLKFFNLLLMHYYPYGVRHFIVYNFTKILRPLWNVTKVMFSNLPKMLNFCNSAKELSEFIPERYILQYMGGLSSFDFTDFEELYDSPSVRELAPLFGFTDEEVDKFMTSFEEQLRDTRRIIDAIKK